MRYLTIFTIGLFVSTGPAMGQQLGNRLNVKTEKVDCQVDTASLLRLPPNEFDQNMTGGWRVLAARAGCEKATADLITKYIDENWSRLKPNNLHPLY